MFEFERKSDRKDGFSTEDDDIYIQIQTETHNLRDLIQTRPARFRPAETETAPMDKLLYSPQRQRHYLTYFSPALPSIPHRYTHI